jgi:hypothetical protein
MPNHFHTDAVQIVATAIGVIIVMHLIRMTGGVLVDSDNRFFAGLGKGLVGTVTFGA